MTSTVRNLFLFIALTTLLITGCTKEEPAKVVEKIRQVSVVTVDETAHKESVLYTGFISASQILPMSFGQNGIVGEVKVTEGQKVKVGDVLLSSVNASSAQETLYAGISGIVSEVINKPGDVVGAGYPVVILRSTKQIMRVGVTDVDLERIEAFGDPVVSVDLDGKSIKAKLDDINRIPDETTRTYTVTVSLDEQDDYLIGKLGAVTFELSRIKGVWLPINYIQNDGEDYVYIVNSENRVERRNLILEEINNDLVRVEGLEKSSRVITVGNSFVKEGQQVTAREASNE